MHSINMRICVPCEHTIAGGGWVPLVSFQSLASLKKRSVMLRGSSFRTGHNRLRKIQAIKANQYFRERFSTAKEQQIRTSRLIAIATCHAFHNTHQSNGFVASDVSART